jgi:hypothetical protein
MRKQKRSAKKIENETPPTPLPPARVGEAKERGRGGGERGKVPCLFPRRGASGRGRLCKFGFSLFVHCSSLRSCFLFFFDNIIPPSCRSFLMGMLAGLRR